MTFIAQDIEDATSEAEQLPKATVPGFRLADAFTNSRTLDNLSQVTNARLAGSMVGMVPRDFNAKLAASMGVAKMVRDLSEMHAGILKSAMPQMSLMQSAAASGVLRDVSKVHAGILKSAMPQVSLAESMAGSMVPRDFNAKLAASMVGMVPRDFNAKLAASMSVAKMVRDLSEMHAGILKSAMPQVSLMQSAAASGVLRDFIEMQTRLAAIARTVPPDSLADTEFGTTLSRGSERLLFGNFVYCLVLSLALLAYIRIIGESETDSQILSLLCFATGLGAHQIARQAREAAFRVYDSLYPPE